MGWVKKTLITGAVLAALGIGAAFATYTWGGELMLATDKAGKFKKEGYFWNQVKAKQELETIVNQGGTSGNDNPKDEGRWFPSIFALDSIAEQNSERNIVAYDSKGREIGTIRANHKYYSLQDFSPMLRNAVITFEDQNFLDHNGVRPTSKMRALIEDIKEWSWVQGGSSLTEQLAKQFYTENGGGAVKKLSRKVKESLTALELEAHYSKSEIFEMYMNICPFPNGTRGYGDAAQDLFGKNADDLTLAEATYLSVIPNQPGATPYTENGRNVIERKQRIVLEKIRDKGQISQDQVDEAIRETGGFNITKKSYVNTDYDDVLNFINRQFMEVTGEQGLLNTNMDFLNNQSAIRQIGGFIRLYTTIDLDIVNDLRRNVNTHRGFRDNEQFGYIVLDAQGKIRGVYEQAGIGDQSPIVVERYQTGSSLFKPFIFATSLDEGLITPYTRINDMGVAPVVFRQEKPVGVTFTDPVGEPWSVSNAIQGSDFLKTQNAIMYHLPKSNNIIAAHLMMSLNSSARPSPRIIKKFLDHQGVDIPDYKDKAVSSVLGTFVESPEEVAYGFMVFNDGTLIKNPTKQASLIFNKININGIVTDYETDQIEVVQMLNPENLKYLQAALWLQQSKFQSNGQQRFDVWGKSGTTQTIYDGSKKNIGWKNLSIANDEYGRLVITGFAKGHGKGSGDSGGGMHDGIMGACVKSWGKTGDRDLYARTVAQVDPQDTQVRPSQLVAKTNDTQPVIRQDLDTVIKNYDKLNIALASETKKDYVLFGGTKVSINNEFYGILSQISLNLAPESRDDYINALNHLHSGVSTKKRLWTYDIGDVLRDLSKAETTQRANGSNTSADSIKIVRTYLAENFDN